MLILIGTGCLSVSPTRTGVVQIESDFYHQNQLALEHGPEYPDVFTEGKTTSRLTDNEKISLLEGEWDSNDLYKFIFPSRLLPKVDK